MLTFGLPDVLGGEKILKCLLILLYQKPGWFNQNILCYRNLCQREKVKSPTLPTQVICGKTGVKSRMWSILTPLLLLSLSQVWHGAAAAKSLQSCPTLCDPVDGRPPGSPVPGILQARTLEWVAISFSNAWKWKVKVKSLSRVRLLETSWTGAYQAPPSMGFSRQEYWSGMPLPSPVAMVSEC